MPHEEIINLYLEGLSSYEIAKRTNSSPTQIRRILKQHNVQTRSNRTNAKQENYILQKYKEGISTEKLSIELNLSATTVARIIKRLGGNIRSASERKKVYLINSNFFETIDSEDKAYFLGLLIADGSINKNQIKLCLQKEDEYIIEELCFRLFVGKKPDLSYDREYAYVTITDDKLVADLAKYGCVQNKTFVTHLPTVTKNVLPHLIRGLVDGDGGVYNYSYKKIASLTGSETLIFQLQEILSELKINSSTYKNKNSFTITISNQQSLKAFLNWIYNEASIFLKRKHESYKGIIQHISQVPTYYGTTNIISYQGKKLTSEFIQTLSKEQRLQVSDYLFNYFRELGFPYDSFSKSELNKDYQKLLQSTQKLSNKLIKSGDSGKKIFKHFCRHYYSVSSISKVSFVDAFKNDELLKSVINNRLGISYKETFNITGNMLKQGFRNSRACFAASIFKPEVAKYIYDNYAPENASVLDISAGFGQRMLGALASNNVDHYTGIDPWSETIQVIESMYNFIGKPKSVKLENVGSENYIPDRKFHLCFSSPPFFNKEIYDKTHIYNFGMESFIKEYWHPTCKMVKEALYDSSYFIINMDKDLFEKMEHPGFELVDIIYVGYDRAYLKTNAKDHFFVMKKD
jgi:transposase